jgi:hypothetical protein
MAGLYLVLATLYVLAVSLDVGHLPPAGIEYHQWWLRQTSSAVSRLAALVSAAAFAVSVLSAVGLLLSWRPARVFFALAVALLLISELLVDYPVLRTTVQTALDSALSLSAGALLALSFTN